MRSALFNVVFQWLPRFRKRLLHAGVAHPSLHQQPGAAAVANRHAVEHDVAGTRGGHQRACVGKVNAAAVKEEVPYRDPGGANRKVQEHRVGAIGSQRSERGSVRIALEAHSSGDNHASGEEITSRRQLDRGVAAGRAIHSCLDERRSIGVPTRDPCLNNRQQVRRHSQLRRRETHDPQAGAQAS